MVSLPWVPAISPKLKKAFKKAGYKAVFKSGKNLERILTSRNKPKLNTNMNPGVYRLQCSCGKKYVGETRLNISSHIEQRQKAAFTGKWERSAVAEHCKSCHGTID